MWILILTMVATHHYGGSSISTTPPFRDEASCMAAANAWLKQVANNYPAQRPTALCVKA